MQSVRYQQHFFARRVSFCIKVFLNAVSNTNHGIDIVYVVAYFWGEEQDEKRVIKKINNNEEITIPLPFSVKGPVLFSGGERLDNAQQPNKLCR